MPTAALGSRDFVRILRHIGQVVPSSTESLLGAGLRVSAATIPKAVKHAYREVVGAAAAAIVPFLLPQLLLQIPTYGPAQCSLFINFSTIPVPGAALLALK